MAKPKLICNCNKTMPLDARALAAALKLDTTPNIASELCRKHVAAFEAAVKNGGDLIVGPGGAALAWAERLAEQFSVSVLVTEGGERFEMPAERRFPVFSGRPRAVKGYLGAFEVEWDQANPIDLETCTRCNACIRVCPERAIDFSYQIDLGKCKAHRQCVKACGEIQAIDFDRKEAQRSDTFDMVLDLSREPLIRLAQPPQGYVAPRGDPLEQALAANQLTRMVGEFEKPRFFLYKESLCAHSRSEIVGCSRCIDVCSTQAISSEKEQNRVKVEPHLCMGCGGCATVCPSGAMSYAYPRVPDIGIRVKTVLQTYRDAGGRDPVLLFHNTTDGRELVARLGRRGRGLPANVIPLEVFHIGSLGLDVTLGAIALGAAQCLVLTAGTEPQEYLAALREQLGFGQQLLAGLGYGEGHLRLIEASDPAALEEAAWGLRASRGLPPATFNLSGEKRRTLDFVFDHLVKQAPAPTKEVALSPGAPYGRVMVNPKTCTLCMACVGACPESALLDSKEAPQLKFIERNCVQCGLCEKTCPEDAITLAPRLLLGREAQEAVVLNAAEPFLCLRCGKPFATRQMIENMVGRLGSHSMFATPEALRRLQMCADCRVIDMMEKEGDTNVFDYRGGGGEAR